MNHVEDQGRVVEPVKDYASKVVRAEEKVIKCG